MVRCLTLLVAFLLAGNGVAMEPLEARVERTLERLAAPGIAEALLPPGTVVDVVARSGDALIVRLTWPENVDPRKLDPLAMEQVGAMLERLLAVEAPELRELDVRARRSGDMDYRALDAFVVPDKPYRRPLGWKLDVPPPADGPTLSFGGPVYQAGRQPSGALSGIIVYTSPGHGYYWNNTFNDWRPQRGVTHRIVEDFGNLDQVELFARYLWNAGATVVPLRPIGRQHQERVLDNDDAGVTFTGSWGTGASNLFYGSPGDVPYRIASSALTTTALARYTPNLPAAGEWPVYAWAAFGDNRANQLYRVTHAGGTTEVRVDHRRVGNGWVWLGTYTFHAGTAGYVEISNQTDTAGQVIVADAIRFGNGMGDVSRGPGISGRPRDEEANRYWVQRALGVGAAASIYDLPDLNDLSDQVGSPARMMSHMNNEAVGTSWQRVYLGWHTNAASGTARGAVGLYRTDGEGTPNQLALAQAVGRELETHMFAIGSPPLEHAFFDRTETFAGVYGEISKTNGNWEGNDNIDATIIEVAFHDNQQDAELLRDPRMRAAAAKAMVWALTKFLNARPGSTVPLAFAPAPPTRPLVRALSATSVEVAWQAPPSGGIHGNPATGYRVYLSANGVAFDGGRETAQTRLELHDLAPGQIYYLRVAAFNAGGESMPTETLTVRTGAPRVLIVNGFDRLSREQNPTQTISFGTFERVQFERSNGFRYVVEHAEALAAVGAAFDSCANEAVEAGDVVLSNYAAVDWLLGEESVRDKTLTADEQAALAGYLDAGGRLFISGSEIGFDLGRSGVSVPADVTFYQTRLRAAYVANSAGMRTVQGVGTFAGLTFTLDDGSGGAYDVNEPDVIAAANGSTLIFNYAGGAGGAGVAHSGNGKLVHLAFPFEGIVGASQRQEVMARVIGFFDLGTTPTSTPSNTPSPTTAGTSTPTHTLTHTATPTPSRTPTPTTALDTDNDGLPDSVESFMPAAGQSHALLADSDGDGLGDGVEDVNKNGIRDSGETGTRLRDSDGDGLWDGMERKLEPPTDPLNALSPLSYVDQDGDGLPAPPDLFDNLADIDGDRYIDGYEYVTVGFAAMGEASVRPSLGDLNLDNQSTNLDALVAQSLFLGLIHHSNALFGGSGFSNSDVNRDGQITNVDALVIQAFFLGSLAHYPL